MYDVPRNACGIFISSKYEEQPARDRVMIDFELERQRKAERVLLATVEAVAELRRKWRSQDEAETIDSILACPVWTVVRSPRGSARSAPTRSWGSRRRGPGAVKKTAVCFTEKIRGGLLPRRSRR
jgi:hypothetical protein